MISIPWSILQKSRIWLVCRYFQGCLVARPTFALLLNSYLVVYKDQSLSNKCICSLNTFSIIFLFVCNLFFDNLTLLLAIMFLVCMTVCFLIAVLANLPYWLYCIVPCEKWLAVRHLWVSNIRLGRHCSSVWIWCSNTKMPGLNPPVSRWVGLL